MKDANEFDMSQMKTDIEQIKETISKMQAQIDILEDRMNTVNPQCIWPSVTAASPDCFKPIYTEDMPLTLSAARELWPLLENEFDRYCTDHKITVWTPTDSEQFYNTYVGIRSRLA